MKPIPLSLHFTNVNHQILSRDIVTHMRNIDRKEQDAQTICTSCGLCCDGTLFVCANLRKEDSAENLNTAGIVAVQGPERRFFRLPCHHLNNRHCQIYRRWRPAICGRFKCKILLRLYAGELTFEQGIEIVRKTLEHVAELKQQIRDSDALDRVSLEHRFSAWWNKQVVPDMAVQLNYAALQFRLDRDFKNKKKDSSGHGDK